MDEARIGITPSGKEFFYTPNAAGGYVLCARTPGDKFRMPSQLATTEVRQRDKHWVVLRTNNPGLRLSPKHYNIAKNGYNPVIYVGHDVETATREAEEWINRMGTFAFDFAKREEKQEKKA
jgi:hypothetical protein